mgnify:FL=1
MLLPNRLVVILHEAVGIAKRVSNEQVIAGLLLLQLLQVFEQLTNTLVLNNIVTWDVSHWAIQFQFVWGVTLLFGHRYRYAASSFWLYCVHYRCSRWRSYQLVKMDFLHVLSCLFSTEELVVDSAELQFQKRKSWFPLMTHPSCISASCHHRKELGFRGRHIIDGIEPLFERAFDLLICDWLQLPMLYVSFM